jgi:hypothetical protein
MLVASGNSCRAPDHAGGFVSSGQPGEAPVRRAHVAKVDGVIEVKHVSNSKSSKRAFDPGWADRERLPMDDHEVVLARFGCVA